jgi:hypothetical protein
LKQLIDLNFIDDMEARISKPRKHIAYINSFCQAVQMAQQILNVHWNAGKTFFGQR